jgi:hypothetical protein
MPGNLSNLPPGVTVGMIPGNREEDMKDYEFWQEFEKKTKETPIPNDAYDAEWFIEAIEIAKQMGYDEGFNDGRDQERLSRD